MIFFELKNSNDKVIASNLSKCKFLDKLSSVESENKRFKGIRNVYKESEMGSVRLIIIDDKDIYSSNKIVNRIVNVYFDLIPEFEELERRKRQYFDLIIRRFIHNLVKVQSKLKGYLQRLASDKTREFDNYQSFREEVERRINNNTLSAANDICQISHRVADLDAQIEGLRVMSGFAEKTKPSLIKINLLNALIRLHHPFVKEFIERAVTIKFNIKKEEAENNKIVIDPQLFNVAMWQFFDNAVKYVKPSSEIIFYFDFSDNKKILKCEMYSVKIEEDEKSKIVKENYKGINAKGIKGDGIGMFVIAKALRLTNASIKVDFDHSDSEEVNNRMYCKNSFIFEFKV